MRSQKKVPLFDFEKIVLNSKFSLVSSHVLLVDFPTFNLIGLSQCDTQANTHIQINSVCMPSNNRCLNHIYFLNIVF